MINYKFGEIVLVDFPESGATESISVEWKPSLSQINEIAETISGFSNTEGGKIIIGVSKSGKLPGIEVGKDTIERLTNKDT